MKKLHKPIRTIWLILAVLSTLWLVNSFQAKGVDDAMLEDDSLVDVEETGDAITFTPNQPALQPTGFIFYHGGMVQPEAYAPMSHTLAEAGFKTIIIKLPFRSAMFASQEAAVMAQTQTIMHNDISVQYWVVGGHSRGAAIASRYAHQYPTELDGLLLIGTSHPKEAAFDLSHLNLKVMKIFATNDGLATVAEVEANAHYLPPETVWVEIKGGNHAQFGYYGSQLRDSRAEISRETQQTLLVDAIESFLETIGRGEEANLIGYNEY